jgi:Uma2 family endonuclease
MNPPTVVVPDLPAVPPDHKQLPESDGAIVENFQEHPQANLLTECLRPRLIELRPDRQFCIGCDSGIYWRWTQPALDGCKAPDWFLVMGVPPMLEGELRRSYVLWRESIRPLVVIEFVSGDGAEERDTTPYQGKFWVYEQGIGAAYYVIYEVKNASIEVFRLEACAYRPVAPNSKGRFPIEPLGIELGIWEGTYREMTLPWLRVWDAATGELLPLADERAETAEGLLVDTRQMLTEETERAEAERKRADTAEQQVESQRKRADEQARLLEEERKRTDEETRLREEAQQKADRFAERLRALGIAPEDV